ncbi:MAG: alpha/beta hydrolase [Actinomycetota bacterium]
MKARRIAATAAAVISLAACSPPWAADPTPTPTPTFSPPVPDLARFYSQALEWEPCGDDECARLLVPVDYAEPQGATLELALLRVPAAGDRQGVLVLDPGGPGGSGTEYAAARQYVVSDAVLDRFDVVGFDPRGVGESSPVQCGTDADLDALVASDGTPDTPEEEADNARLAEEFVAACTAPVPGLLEHLSTADAARDMDVLRAALGQSRLDYLGVSYGTHLGATYAALFPQNVGRFVLDGPLPAELTAEEVSLEQARGFEDALMRFIDDCLGRDDCPFSGDRASAVTQLRGWLDALDSEPAPTGDDARPLTEGAATYAILMMLYSPETDWPNLRLALSDLSQGVGITLQQLLDSRMRRDANGVYANNSSEAFYAVSCLDRPVSGGAESARELADVWKAELPVLGEYFAWGNLPCATWPVPVVPPTLPTSPLPPMLVVATTHDPATPIAWGPVLVEQLGSATLLVRDGDGHTAYREGSECIDEAIDAFLIDGVLPEPGTVCT